MLRRVYVVCLIVYSGVVAWITLRSLALPDGTPDLVPFLETWHLMRDNGDRAALREVAGNFVLFIPFGFFLAATIRRHLWAVGALAGLTSVLIETAQWVVVDGRNPSIDDVIYNTAGAAAGAIVFALACGAVAFRRDRPAAPVRQGGRAPD